MAERSGVTPRGIRYLDRSRRADPRYETRGGVSRATGEGEAALPAPSLPREFAELSWMVFRGLAMAVLGFGVAIYLSPVLVMGPTFFLGLCASSAALSLLRHREGEPAVFAVTTAACAAYALVAAGTLFGLSAYPDVWTLGLYVPCAAIALANLTISMLIIDEAIVRNASSRQKWAAIAGFSLTLVWVTLAFLSCFPAALMM